MSAFHGLPQHARQVLQSLIGLGLVLYFGVHAVQGDRGLTALSALQAQHAERAAEAAVVAAQRAELESRVALLRSDSIDPDMLEERARLLLNFAQADEWVIPITAPTPPRTQISARPRS